MGAAELAAGENKLGDVFGFFVLGIFFKPYMQGAHNVVVKFQKLKLFELFSDVCFIQTRVVLTVDPQIHNVPNANAGIPVMLGKVGKQVDHFIAGLHSVPEGMAFHGAGKLPAISIVLVIVLVVGGDQPLVELDGNGLLFPHKLVVALVFFRVAQFIHKAAYGLVFAAIDENVRIAHPAHLAAGVQGLQKHALQGHMGNAAGLQFLGNLLNCGHLGLADRNALINPHGFFLHRSQGLAYTAKQRSVIHHNIYTVAFRGLERFCRIKIAGQSIRLSGEGAFYQ